ncbi:MAG: 50S ribosomal protein L22, partial [Proteobacteria bacterium]|nr:50S ribosomal protein L22 [Pseudomonadota bacterium]
MPHYDYGYQGEGNKEDLAKAQQYNIDASYKDLCAVCTNIRGLTQDDGRKYLLSVLNDGFPVKYVRWNKHLGHRRELGGARGRYPVKAAKFVLMVLTNAIANADTKGILDGVIVHASANKQSIYSRLQPKGRQSKANYETARIEIAILGKAAAKKVEAPKKKEKPSEEKKLETKTETKTETKPTEI